MFDRPKNGAIRVAVGDVMPDNYEDVSVELNGARLELAQPYDMGGRDNWVGYVRHHPFADKLAICVRWPDGNGYDANLVAEAGKVLVISARDPARTGLIDAAKWAEVPEV